jgi:hypothetical protein
MKKFIAITLISTLYVWSCTISPEPAQPQSKIGQSTKNAKVNGQNVGILYAEFLTIDNPDEAGNTVYFKNVGNKQLGADFVAGDPRRGGRTNINYHIDNQLTTDAGLGAMAVKQALVNAMNTWNAEGCSDINLTQKPYNGDAGFVQNFYGFGGSVDFSTDIQHNGWLPAAFFHAISPPNGSNSILGVTYTLIYFDDNGMPTDIDKNKKADVAIREIYYNDRFAWKTSGNTGIDIETVSLHEAGHALSQGHFGKLFEINANGNLHFSPRSVMNAGYTGVQQSLAPTDMAGHCSNWSSWPNK